MLKKTNEVEVVNKTPEKTEVDNLENLYKSSEEFLIFFRDHTKVFFDASYEAITQKIY